MEDLQGERVREKNGFQSAGNPVYIYIIISTLTCSSPLSLSLRGLFKNSEMVEREMREGFRLLLEVCCCCFIHSFPYFLKNAASCHRGLFFFFFKSLPTHLPPTPPSLCRYVFLAKSLPDLLSSFPHKKIKTDRRKQEKNQVKHVRRARL